MNVAFTRKLLAASVLSAAMVLLPVAATAVSTTSQAPAVGADLTARVARVRASLMAGAGRPGDLIAELQDILGADPTIAEAHMLLGLAYRGVGGDMLPEAVAELRQALALDPTLVAGRYHLANTYLDLGRAERAREELLLGLEQAPGQMQFTTLLAEAERRAGLPERALELARQVPAADPSAPQARYHSALALLDLDRRAEAMAELERLVADGVTPPDVLSVLGIAYVDAGRNDDAVQLLSAATAVVPNRPDLHVAIGRAHRQAGRYAEAEAALARALPPGANREASAFYESLEADIHLETGLIRLAQERLDDVVQELRAALELRPTHGPTHRHLAQVYLRQNRRDLAVSHARAARAAGETLPAELAALVPSGAGE